MTPIGVFPFGEPVQEVVHTDRTHKRVFVLGVYASAVHARWVGPDNKTVVNALAVASEPYIFWRGDNAEVIIRHIAIPSEVGKLVPANPQYNGPSGIALDELILKPLGLTRNDVWLCDLVPHSCMNPSQVKAIERAYLPMVRRYKLSLPTVPVVPQVLVDETRQRVILKEIQESEADIVIVLGDMPIRWFLRQFDGRWKKLANFGCDNQSYGKLHEVHIGKQKLAILPLAHPRQIAKLGQSSVIWYQLHQEWVNKYAYRVLNPQGAG
jgi:hypothetical protein